MKSDAKKQKVGTPTCFTHGQALTADLFLFALKMAISHDCSFIYIDRLSHTSIPSICLFSSSAVGMDDKAQGVSGVPRTKALWPSAMAWLCQSLALLTAEWLVEWYNIVFQSKAGRPFLFCFLLKLPVGMFTLLPWHICHPSKTLVALWWSGSGSHKVSEKKNLTVISLVWKILNFEHLHKMATIQSQVWTNAKKNIKKRTEKIMLVFRMTVAEVSTTLVTTEGHQVSVYSIVLCSTVLWVSCQRD